jgi:hypothetical protein
MLLEATCSCDAQLRRQLPPASATLAKTYSSEKIGDRSGLLVNFALMVRHINVALVVSDISLIN